MSLVNNSILLGDSADLLADETLFPSNSIDLIVTSPPYADRRKENYRSVSSKKYVEWFTPISEQLYRVLKKRGSFILNIKEHTKNHERQTYVLELVLKLKEQGWLWIEEYCWYKKTAFPGHWRNKFRDSWERCYHFSKQTDIKIYQDNVKVPIGSWSKERFLSESKNDRKRLDSSSGSGLSRKVSNWHGKRKVYPSNVLEFAPVTNNRSHSAAFPKELPAWFIKLLTRKGNVVLDPFIGSGTTAIAAKELGRQFVGIEIERKHLRIAEENLSH